MTLGKRQKEREREEHRKAKEERKKKRKEESANRPEGDSGVDPDIAGIIPGPQLSPEQPEAE